jgi:hypothetical protein
MDFSDVLQSLDGNSSMKAISRRERERIRKQMEHIENLKEGDKVQWKRGFRSSRFPLEDETVEVFRVFPKRERALSGSSRDSDEDDFSVIFRNVHGRIDEFTFDSRRFERVG